MEVPMRFVDVPVSSPPVHKRTTSPISYRRAPLSLEPIPTPPPSITTLNRRAPARPTRATPRPLKRAWSNLSWTLSTWWHARTRAANLRAFTPAPAPAPAPEIVYVSFAR